MRSRVSQGNGVLTWRSRTLGVYLSTGVYSGFDNRNFPRMYSCVFPHFASGLRRGGCSGGSGATGEICGYWGQREDLAGGAGVRRCRKFFFSKSCCFLCHPLCAVLILMSLLPLTLRLSGLNVVLGSRDRSIS